MSEDHPARVEREPDVFIRRNVTRLINPSKHQPGMNVANFMGDLTKMLTDGEFYGVQPQELRILAHLYRTAIQPADNAEGAIVSLCGRHWGAFVGIRRTYIAARRKPANLIACLRATRATS